MTEARAPESQDADWETLERVAAGDGDAFERLVERHQARLLAVCERMLGDREEARDAAQEVFLRVFRHAAGVERRGQLFTWIYRIAVNHCLNRLRRRRLARFLPFATGGGEGEDDRRPPEPADPGADPETELATRERWRATRAAVDRLPPGQRAVLVLARFEGLSYREIAATLGLTESAVESRLVRAMRRLAAQEGAPPRVPREEKAP